MRWIRLSIRTNPVAVDAVSAAMEARGTGGTLFEGDSTAVGFLPADDRFETTLDSLRAALAEMPALGIDPAPSEITLTFVDDVDWSTAWREHFKPARITERLTISPTWVDYAPEAGELVIRLDPGMAFGTGGHATTRLCMLALQSLIRGGEHVADIGTGSGVLAIAAVLLGAAHVDAVDTDPIAVRVAIENVAANGAGDAIDVSDADCLTDAASSYDVVVANILPPIVRDLAPSAFRALKAGGIYIVSGLTLPHEAMVAEALASAGFRPEGRWEEERWVALAGRRPE